MTSNETREALDRLKVTREELMKQLCATAIRVTGPEAWEQMNELARLKGHIEALDFAIANPPPVDPQHWAKAYGRS